jgi:hypothetical protein
MTCELKLSSMWKDAYRAPKMEERNSTKNKRKLKSTGYFKLQTKWSKSIMWSSTGNCKGYLAKNTYSMLSSISVDMHGVAFVSTRVRRMWSISSKMWFLGIWSPFRRLFWRTTEDNSFQESWRITVQKRGFNSGMGLRTPPIIRVWSSVSTEHFKPI